MTKTIDIRVDGEEVEIEVEELSPLEMLRWSAKAPNSIKTGNPEDAVTDPKLVDYLVDLTKSQTLLTEELLEEVPAEEISRLFNGVAGIAFDSEVDLSRDERDFSQNETIEFNDDGSVDLSDWQ